MYHEGDVSFVFSFCMMHSWCSFNWRTYKLALASFGFLTNIAPFPWWGHQYNSAWPLCSSPIFSSILSAIIQVWSLTHLYYVDISQSRIGVKSASSTNVLSGLAMAAVFDQVLPLARHSWLNPCSSLVPEQTSFFPWFAANIWWFLVPRQKDWDWEIKTNRERDH